MILLFVEVQTLFKLQLCVRRILVRTSQDTYVTHVPEMLEKTSEVTNVTRTVVLPKNISEGISSH